MSFCRIHSIGNSKVISLPEHLLAQIGADTGDYLNISVEGEKIILARDTRNRLSLEECWKALRQICFKPKKIVSGWICRLSAKNCSESLVLTF